MQIENYIRAVPDFPQAWILFRDIAPLLACPEAFDSAIEQFSQHVKKGDIIVGLDARGFIFASALALRTGNPLVMIRKPGKLPWELFTQSYDLEYGHNTLAIQKSALNPWDRVVLVDDVLATGGTMQAARELVLSSGASIPKILFLIELDGLAGRQKLGESHIVSLLHY